jgi:hypothetical protein
VGGKSNYLSQLAVHGRGLAQQSPAYVERMTKTFVSATAANARTFTARV